MDTPSPTQLPPADAPSSCATDRETREALETFFAAGLVMPILPEATDSFATRAPGEWDMHLSEDLRMKQVKYLPSLREYLLHLPLEGLKMRTRLPPNLRKFPTERAREAVREEHKLYIRHESELCRFYERATASHCSVVAATLEFGLHSWSRGPMQWSIGPTVSSNKAVGDGYLRCIGMEPPAAGGGLQAASDGEFPNVPGDTGVTATSNDNADIPWASMMDFFPDLAVWEFKNLNFATLEFFAAIMGFTSSPEPFPWVSCPRNSCRHGLSKPKPKGRPQPVSWITRAKMGFDAIIPGLDLEKEHQWVAPEINPQGPTTQTKSGRKKTAKGTAKLHTKALHVLQQTWAQATKADATFVSISAGTVEILGLRHRGTQTLYLSDIILPCSDKNYHQQETGFFIAIFRDAIERTKLLAAGPVPDTRIFYQDGLPKNPRDIIGFHPLEQEEILDNILSRPILHARAVKNTKFLPFINEEQYYRYKVRLDGAAWPAKITHGVQEAEIMIKVGTGDDCWAEKPHICKASIYVDGQLYNPATAKSSAVALEKKLTSKVIIKGEIASRGGKESLAVKQLNKEAQAYTAFRDAGLAGVPQFVGLFKTLTKHSAVPGSILVISDAGRPAVINKLTREQKDRFIEILEAIHQEGWLHGGLSATKLLIDHHDEPSIVGFGQADRQDPWSINRDAQKKAEMRLLRNILDGDSKDEDSSRKAEAQRIKRALEVQLGPFHQNLASTSEKDLEDIFRDLTRWMEDALGGWDPLYRLQTIHVLEHTSIPQEASLILRFMERDDVETFFDLWDDEMEPEARRQAMAALSAKPWFISGR
ncbi:hypothetical protein HMN09_01111100 [Mycena chlorophos]|uniref:Protein kinase domain-containing protein n=1 Tax=Mycena chlorophos TaxID=658473 RepID=A0A8H6SCI9_MYCCL|nr:hypothetical protein HMN09_01111100 [Mycena chlorophos]